MICKKCEEKKPCIEGERECDCVQKDMSTDCSVYTGDDLVNSGIEKNTILTTAIQKLDGYIGNIKNDVFDFIARSITLVNIGGGSEVYKQINGLGNKELRTVVSGNTSSLEVVQKEYTIEIIPGVISLVNDEGGMELVMTTSEGTTSLGFIPLIQNTDSYVQQGLLDETNSVLTLTVPGANPVDISLDYLNNHVESGTYNSGNVVLTMTNGEEVTIDLSNLISSLSTTQVKSDYLENQPASPAYIENRNPEKTITLGASGSYNVVNSDKNYIIEVDNGNNDVTIDFTDITDTSNYFVGFVQKGTGLVTFIGADIVPIEAKNELYGQGKNASLSIINSTKYLQGQLKFA